MEWNVNTGFFSKIWSKQWHFTHELLDFNLRQFWNVFDAITALRSQEHNFKFTKSHFMYKSYTIIFTLFTLHTFCAHSSPSSKSLVHGYIANFTGQYPIREAPKLSHWIMSEMSIAIIVVQRRHTLYLSQCLSTPLHRHANCHVLLPQQHKSNDKQNCSSFRSTKW